MLQHKNILLGVTGSIAAYKSCELVRMLKRRGADVTVIMTEAANNFVTGLTLQTLSNNRVFSGLFDRANDYDVEHIALADRADLILIAPATANCIGRIANGIADDLLTCVVMASRAPVVICPAMNQNMYANAVLQENIDKLKKKGFIFINPEKGELACGCEGEGRLASLEAIVDLLSSMLSGKNDLAGKTVLITAGPTREPLDPVRFLSNYSSGMMGFSLASVANQRGARVILVSGPVSMTPPQDIKTVIVQTAAQMHSNVMKYFRGADIIIGAAAVSDYRPRDKSLRKITKSNKTLTLDLVQNKDILADLGTRKGNKILVGFALETNNLIQNARIKLKNKNLDMIVANRPQDAFTKSTNKVVILTSRGQIIKLPQTSKINLSQKMFDILLQM